MEMDRQEEITDMNDENQKGLKGDNNQEERWIWKWKSVTKNFWGPRKNLNRKFVLILSCK